ncbi:cyanophycinase [Roseisolibacter agri]|uniref:Cyanophycinase n=1 Tax=Roseisolibacter agri TaxID=2014610 RepID=A0AA37QB25_9BACT|nr:cyanophycinase [Roseisolibacter agri]GLC25626.1 cyanophycinase [Roseisolibacter agri]
MPSTRASGRPRYGTLVIVGGHEDKTGERVIHRALVHRLGGGGLAIATVASEQPDALWREYAALFRTLGVADVRHLAIASRAEADAPEAMAALDGVRGVFFTGGDQLRITGLLGGTLAAERIRDVYETGGLVGGTSAGASVMSVTMLVSGAAEESHRLGGSLRMAPGLGLLPDVIVDQHFAERGRVGRLLGAVAQNPTILGVGIDENTAVLVEQAPDAPCFRVVGEGGVFVVDGQGASYTNVSEEEENRTLSLFGVRLHVLSQGDEFDLASRTPTNHPAEEVDAALGLRDGAS